jgi:hypothetical protein
MAKQSGGAFGVVSMVVAFVVIGLFLYWLSIVSEPTATAVAEEGSGTTSPVVSLGDFAMNPMAHMEAPVELDGIEVQEIVGAHAFYFALPGGSPYLVRLPAPVGAQGIQVVPGDRVRVTGRVEMMTDNVLQAWDSLGVFADSAQRMTAASLASFLQADVVQVTEAAGAAVLPPTTPGQE